jgi:hypothetical protein
VVVPEPTAEAQVEEILIRAHYADNTTREECTIEAERSEFFPDRVVMLRAVYKKDGKGREVVLYPVFQFNGLYAVDAYIYNVDGERRDMLFEATVVVELREVPWLFKMDGLRGRGACTVVAEAFKFVEETLCNRTR